MLLALLILIFVFSVIYIIVKDEYMKERAEERHKQLEKDKGINKHLTLKHLEGLELAQGSTVNFSTGKDCWYFSSGNQLFTLDIDNITKVEVIDTDTIVNDNRFSIKKAALGTLLFGGVGGAIGGYSGSDKSINYKGLVIECINKDNQVQNLLFTTSYNGDNLTTLKKINNEIENVGYDLSYVINRNNTKKESIIKEI